GLYLVGEHAEVFADVRPSLHTRAVAAALPHEGRLLVQAPKDVVSGEPETLGALGLSSLDSGGDVSICQQAVALSAGGLGAVPGPDRGPRRVEVDEVLADEGRLARRECFRHGGLPSCWGGQPPGPRGAVPEGVAGLWKRGPADHVGPGC